MAVKNDAGAARLPDAVTFGTAEEYETFLANLCHYQDQQRCAVLCALDALAGKWTARVAFRLLKCGRMRFGEIRRQLPDITNNMLASTLHDMGARGLVTREQFNEIPPRVEYELTPLGEALLPVFFELSRWGSRLAKE